MAIGCQMRRGLARLMEADAADGHITRAETVINERGAIEPTGTMFRHTLRCRIAEASGVWGRQPWAGGESLDSGPCLFAPPGADVQTGDTLEWRGQSYLVGEVSRPHLGGLPVATQAKLTAQSV